MEFMGEHESGGDVFGRCRGREVDRFRYAAVAMSLEDRLHSHMLFGGDIVCGQEQSAEILRNQRQMLTRFMAADLTAQCGEREASGGGSLEELRVHAFERISSMIV